MHSDVPYNQISKDINYTRAIQDDTEATSLLCIEKNAAKKMEALRQLFCLPPLQPSRPGCIKAYRDATIPTEEWKKQEDVVESRMWMADPLLNLIHSASCDTTPKHFHQHWHTILKTDDTEIIDEIVPLNNIVKPPNETIFPVIDNSDDDEHENENYQNNNENTPRSVASSSAATKTNTNKTPILIRHGARIPPSSGHVDGDYSIGVHDRSIACSGQEGISETREGVLVDATSTQGRTSPNSSVARIRHHPSSTRNISPPRDQQQIAETSPSPSSQSQITTPRRRHNNNKLAISTAATTTTTKVVGPYHQNYFGKNKTEEEVDFEEKSRQIAKYNCEKQELQRRIKNEDPVLFRWKLSVIKAAAQQQQQQQNEQNQQPTIAFVKSPLSATSVHRCSIQILSYANSPEIPKGASVLANGIFERPGAMFGLCHKTALLPTNSTKSNLWAGMMWKQDRGATLPGACMMVSTTNSGMPMAKLPNLGKRRDDEEHYVRVGDILTIETRPVVERKVSNLESYLFGPSSSSSSVSSSLNNNTPPPVSVHFFINNVEICSWSNLALLQPYSLAKNISNSSTTTQKDEKQNLREKLITSQEQEHSLNSVYSLENMYFGVRMFPGTEIGIISGDVTRIAEAVKEI